MQVLEVEQVIDFNGSICTIKQLGQIATALAMHKSIAIVNAAPGDPFRLGMLVEQLFAATEDIKHG